MFELRDNKCILPAVFRVSLDKNYFETLFDFMYQRTRSIVSKFETNDIEIQGRGTKYNRFTLNFISELMKDDIDRSLLEMISSGGGRNFLGASLYKNSSLYHILDGETQEKFEHSIDNFSSKTQNDLDNARCPPSYHSKTRYMQLEVSKDSLGAELATSHEELQKIVFETSLGSSFYVIFDEDVMIDGVEYKSDVMHTMKFNQETRKNFVDSLKEYLKPITVIPSSPFSMLNIFGVQFKEV